MTTSSAHLRGVLHFLTPETESSLYRNSRVRMKRDDRGNFVDSQGVETLAQELNILNARQIPATDMMTLENNGFELKRAEVADYDYLDHQQVIGGYYADCAKLVEKVTGARAWAFDHNIRSAGGQAEKRRVRGGQDVQGPAHIVHGDYTLRSAPERLGQLARPPSINDTLRDIIPQGQGLIPQNLVDAALEPGGRFAIINADVLHLSGDDARGSALDKAMGLSGLAGTERWPAGGQRCGRSMHLQFSQRLSRCAYP